MICSPSESTVVIRGAGDLGSGVLYRLWRVGFSPIALERPEPLTVRRQVAFATAVHEGTTSVEGVRARLVEDPRDAGADEIPVIVDEDAERIGELEPDILIDATMVRYADRIGTTIDMAPLTIALGPGFTAGEDVDYVVETNRGHRLGRVIEQGTAQEPTGEPSTVQGVSHDRVLRAPADGEFQPTRAIGDSVEEDDVIATVNGEDLHASVDGVIRGLIHPGTTVHEGLKVGDVDPRGKQRDVPLISDKALAIGGGVLEAIGYHLQRGG